MNPLTQLFQMRRNRATHAAGQSGAYRGRHSLAVAVATLLALAVIVFAPTVMARAGRTDGAWVATWSASPQSAGAPLQISGQTIRQIVHTSLGGRRVRVRLSNAYGQSPLRPQAAIATARGI